MSTVELAERKARARALVFLLFAAIIAGVLGVGLARPDLGGGVPPGDFLRGFWVGISIVAVLFLLPWGRWLRPSAPLARLLDDEAVREHRRISCAAGFWASMAATLAATVIPSWQVSAFDTARLIATAAIVVAFLTFASLELRAARG